MIADDAMEVHFRLKLLDRARDHVSCHNYPSVNQAPAVPPAPEVHVEFGSLPPQRRIHKCVKLGCAVAAFPLDP